MSLDRLRPEALRSFEQAEVWNALISRCGQSIPLAAENVSAVLNLVDPPSRIEVAAVIAAAEQKIVVAFQSFPFEELFGVDLPMKDLGRLPQPLQEALIEGMLGCLWDLIPCNRLGPFSVLENLKSQPLSDGFAPLNWFSARIDGMAREPAQIVVGCAAANVIDAITEGKLASRAAWPALREQLKIETLFTLASLDLTIDEIRTLEPGAAILLPTKDKNVLSVRFNDTLYVFCRKPDGVICEGVRPSATKQKAKREDVTMMDDKLDQAPANELAQNEDTLGFSSLMLQVDFDIGSARVSLTEIETWRAGSLVELEPPDVSEGVEVTLRVHGQALATGELIRIDERLGVRLNRLLMRG